MKYLLPCKCGQSVEVEPGQAGQTVVCVCGENLLVPSMMQVKALPAAQDKSPSREEAGVLRRTFLILGVALLIPSICLAVNLYQQAPQPQDVSLKPEYFSFGTNKRLIFQNSTPISDQEHTILWITDEDIDRMMPMDLYFYFQTLESPTFSYNFDDNYGAIKDTHRIWVTANVILFFLSLLSIVASFFMPKQQTVVTGWSGSEWR